VISQKSHLKLKFPIQTLINPNLKNWISQERIKIFQFRKKRGLKSQWVLKFDLDMQNPPNPPPPLTSLSSFKFYPIMAQKASYTCSYSWVVCMSRSNFSTHWDLRPRFLRNWKIFIRSWDIQFLRFGFIRVCMGNFNFKCDFWEITKKLITFFKIMVGTSYWAKLCIFGVRRARTVCDFCLSAQKNKKSKIGDCAALRTPKMHNLAQWGSYYYF
jgi:hypothetical protein